MKYLISLIGLLFLVSINAQIADTTIHTEFEIANREYNSLTPLSILPLLDRAVTVDRNQIKRMREDSTSIKNIRDFMMLYHTFNLSDPLIDRADSTFTFTQRVFNYWNDISANRGRFTLPLGIIYQEATIIKDESYLNGDLQVNTNQLDNGWQLSPGKTFADISETHKYFAIAPTYDIPIYDQEISFVLTPEFISSEKDIDYINLQYGANNYILYVNDTLDFNLIATDTIFSFDVHFTDGQVITQEVSFVINDNYYVDKFKQQTIIGHTYEHTQYGKLRYAVLWGDCNNTGYLNKPFLMLHGFRPDVQPNFPSLNTLYSTKFNFKGTSYGNDGFVDLLVKRGFDVIIVRIDPGYRSIRKGGNLLAAFFEEVIEPSKEVNKSKHENIVLGFSMGGHYWRHMLMLLEHKHLNLDYYFHHHTRMWIPFDTPLQGANNPLAHQFAAKSMAIKPAGNSGFNIAYNNMNTDGSREQQRYDVNGYAGNDGAPHRFHQKRRDYNFELENTFSIGPALTKHKGFPSSTRNIGVSVGSYNNDDYFTLHPADETYYEHSQFNVLVYYKKYDVKLRAAQFKPVGTTPAEVFYRRVRKKWVFGPEITLVDDSFYLNEWLELDNCYGSYINDIWENVNTGLKWNSFWGFTDYEYDKNIAFVPTLSALAIDQTLWPPNMRYDMRANGLMYDELSDIITNPNHASQHFGYPHLGRPNDYHTLTPMDAVYINENTYQHITLIDDENGQNDQSVLITFLLNEAEPWYLDLQNQNLGEYARSNYVYPAHYLAKRRMRLGKNISPKTPFGDYNILANVLADYQSGEVIELKPGSHVQQGASAHFYISSMCYWSGGAKSMVSTNSTDSNFETSDNWSTNNRKEEWNLYPNPSDGKVTIQSSFVKEGDILYIYSIMGELLGEFVLDRKGSTDISQLKSKQEILIVKWESNGQLKGTRKLIFK